MKRLPAGVEASDCGYVRIGYIEAILMTAILACVAAGGILGEESEITQKLIGYIYQAA
jgi:hypothetical protein